MEEDQAVETTHTVMYMEAFGVKEADAIEIQARAGEWKAMTEREPTIMSKEEAAVKGYTQMYTRIYSIAHDERRVWRLIKLQ